MYFPGTTNPSSSKRGPVGENNNPQFSSLSKNLHKRNNNSIGKCPTRVFLSLQCLRVCKFLLHSHHGFLLHPWCHRDNAAFLQRQASTRSCSYVALLQQFQIQGHALLVIRKFNFCILWRVLSTA